MKCSVCKKQVAEQWHPSGGCVAAPHPAHSRSACRRPFNKGKGICDGSGRPEKKR